MMGDNFLFNRYAIADRLNKFVWELDTLTVEEYGGWLAYLEILNQRKR